MKAVIVLVAALLSLSACSSGVTGAGEVTSSPTVSGSSASAPDFTVAPSSARESPSVPESKAIASTPPAIADFTKVRYTVPSTFVRTSGYSQAVPLEEVSVSYYFVPKQAYNGRDVLTVLLYTLPQDVDVSTPQQQSDRVDYYNKKLGATLPNGTREATIAGIQGFQQNVVQPPDYHYATWFAFGQHHLLQFSCQVGSTRTAANVIATACQSMLDSLRVS